MKKLLFFAAVLAIAFVAATQFGLHILFIGIAICFFGEAVVFDAGGILEPVRVYEDRIKNSRIMLVCHAGWYVCTLLLAAFFDVLGGYTYYVETPVGNSFEYTPVHQDGQCWYILIVALIIRGIMQLIFEKRIKENIEKAKSLLA